MRRKQSAVYIPLQLQNQDEQDISTKQAKMSWAARSPPLPEE
ncbi:MAG: hypothetical protein AB1765_10555 [Candidatus Hydrogenedentota bacterium]